MAKDNGGGEFFAGFLLGGLVGAVLALLFAPQPGKETVAMIREKGIELKERVSELAPEETKETIKKAVKEAIQEGKQAAARTKEEMLSKLEQLKVEKAAEEPPASEITLS